ncbi:SHOCT domain-containing protein [Streptomyces tirandamycinicus]|uniref:SHOCT domain-containing protein n=1 Tax=Streptomyces tirandamycinicus TaxID=2174846 RepID=UPI003429AABC
MPRLIRRVVRTAAIAGTATAVSGRVSRRQSGRWAQQDQQQNQQNQQNQQAQPQQAQAPSGADPAAAQAQGAVPPPMPPDDEMGRKIDRLKELGELKAQGLLTEQEFAAEKQKVLG